ncbi:MAG: hypothetical protein A2Z05_01445 [Chloroflexi bacterium RBG_16_60_22]|nr:MAG: hypothetical protein A2Z05_01445 [Chloroflexi bacterium RBG_16_60_22]
MAEELGRIEKPPAADYKKGRRLYFIPLMYRTEDSPEEYVARLKKYWEQVAGQVADLEAKLGRARRIYHELIAVGGEEGDKAIAELSEASHDIIKSCLEKEAQLEAVEDLDTLTEFMDWNRCLLMGLQNPGVMNKVYEAYTGAARKRKEYISRKIDETLQADETGILFMRENHQVQFPPDIQVFYVAPPALDDIKRWLREFQSRAAGENGEK